MELVIHGFESKSKEARGGRSPAVRGVARWRGYYSAIPADVILSMLLRASDDREISPSVRRHMDVINQIMERYAAESSRSDAVGSRTASVESRRTYDSRESRRRPRSEKGRSEGSEEACDSL